MPDPIASVAIILLMVAANALYVAAEFATVGARRTRVQDAAESGDRNAQRLLRILKDPVRLDDYVAGCQVGITVSSLVAGSVGQASLTPLLSPLLGPVGGPVAAIGLVLVLITGLQVVLGELLPKSVALRHPERLALATLLPMRMSLWLFRPLIVLFNGSAALLLRLLRVDPGQGHTHVHSPEELEDLYRESAAGGLIDAAERDMVAGALNVDHRLVREIMTPRNRVVTTPANEPVGTALPRLAETPYSRFPVIGAFDDDVVGIVHLRSLFQAAERDPSQPVSAVMRAPTIVAEVMSVPLLWKTLREGGRHSAIVVNEYGSMAGMVTLEDALEEVFGELQDEFDHEEDPIVELDGRVTVLGSVLVETLNSRFDLNMPTDVVDTIGGWVWHELGRIPEVGDEVPLGEDGPVLRVEAVDRRAMRKGSFRLPERAAS